MNIQGKIWGHTSKLFNKNNVEIHRICGKKGGFCSKHKHMHKYNMFFIEKGQLTITQWKNGLVDETPITYGQSCCIPPEDYHMFRVDEDDTVAYEIYWVEIQENDIIREKLGHIE